MSEGLSLLKALLNNEFYTKNKEKIVLELFPTQLHGLVDSIIAAQELYQTDLSTLEVQDLYFTDNPTLTLGAKNEVKIILSNLDALGSINKDVYGHIISTAWRQELARRAADKLLGISENAEDISIEEVRKILDSIDGSEEGHKDNVEYITTDVEELIKATDNTYKWNFNIPNLAGAVGKIGCGTFGIIGAVPDSGKSAFIINSVFSRGGFLEQGARVHLVCNEEPAQRTMMRGINSYTGMTFEEVRENPKAAQEMFNKIKGNIYIQSSVDMTITGLDKYCKEREVDILIVDQLDKVKITGMSRDSSDVSTINAIYVASREIAKRRNLAFIGVCQAGADAQGKLYFGYDSLYGSKTGKAAEADYILCLGMETPAPGESDKGYRMINIAKNKSPSGNKVPIPCQINLPLSRIVA